LHAAAAGSPSGGPPAAHTAAPAARHAAWDATRRLGRNTVLAEPAFLLHAGASYREGMQETVQQHASRQ